MQIDIHNAPHQQNEGLNPSDHLDRGRKSIC
jgi:hypothetical protein